MDSLILLLTLVNSAHLHYWFVNLRFQRGQHDRNKAEKSVVMCVFLPERKSQLWSLLLLSAGCFLNTPTPPPTPPY